jgi:uncharacterized peroxidase-related enzyme
MTWITTVAYEKASGRLKKLYDRIKGPNNNVDNIMLAHSLRPHTLEGHMALYKHVLHHSSNMLEKSYLETIGVYVSMLNDCAYCVEHHFAGLTRLLDDEARATEIRQALEDDEPSRCFSGKELAGLNYAAHLTLDPATLAADSIEELRRSGFDDGEILEINQVSAYFSYANRTVLGLGIDTDGDVIGLSPGDSDDSKNWSHL